MTLLPALQRFHKHLPDLLPFKIHMGPLERHHIDESHPSCMKGKQEHLDILTPSGFLVILKEGHQLPQVIFGQVSSVEPRVINASSIFNQFAILDARILLLCDIAVIFGTFAGMDDRNFSHTPRNPIHRHLG